jgi:hypothetical protein
MLTRLKEGEADIPETGIPEDAPSAAQYRCALFPCVQPAPDRHLPWALSHFHVLQQNMDRTVCRSGPETPHFSLTRVLDAVADQCRVQHLRPARGVPETKITQLNSIKIANTNTELPITSPARTLGSWVQIQLMAWMSVCIYSVLVLSCVCSGLATGWWPIRGVLPTVEDKETSKTTRFTDALCSKWEKQIDRLIDR